MSGWQPQRDPRYQQWPPPQPPQWQPPGQPGPYRQPPRRRHTGRTVAIIAACGVLTFIVVGAIASSGKAPQPSPAASGAQASAPVATQAAAPAAASTITFVVTGSQAQVTYGDGSSNSQGTVPMHETARLGNPLFYSIQAQLQGSGSVTCKILINGAVISQATASGGYNIAMCEVSKDPLSGQWTDTNTGA